jgi:hypothetical protein
MARERARIAGVNGQGAPDGADEIDEIDKQVVDREDQEADPRKQGKLRRDAAEYVRQGHGNLEDRLNADHAVN